MNFFKVLFFLGIIFAQSQAFIAGQWVTAATVKLARVNGTNGVFKINEASPQMSGNQDNQMTTYYFSVDLSTQQGREAYSTILMAKYTGQIVQFYLPNNSSTSLNLVDNFTLGQDL